MLGVDAAPARSVSDRAFAKARSRPQVPALNGGNGELLARAETRRSPAPLAGLPSGGARRLGADAGHPPMSAHAALGRCRAAPVLAVTARCRDEAACRGLRRHLVQARDARQRPGNGAVPAMCCYRTATPRPSDSSTCSTSGVSASSCAATAVGAAGSACAASPWAAHPGRRPLRARTAGRGHLGSVSGLSQHALLIDVAAKTQADNLAVLLARAARQSADAAARDRPFNRTYTQTVLQYMAPRLLVFADDITCLVCAALSAIVRTIKTPKAAAIGAPKPPHDQALSEDGRQGAARTVRVNRGLVRA